MLTKVIILASALLSHPATSAPNPVTSSPNSGQLLGIEDSGQDFNLSLANLLPEASISGSDVGNCASSTKFLSWRTKDWLIEDCYAAVHNLYLTEVLTHPDQPYEFVARGASATKPKLTVQQTPRKYVFRSCVLTVMMLEWFSPSQLPDGRIYTEPKTEVSSYRQIYTAAKAIENKCTLARDPGWAAIGDPPAMGVFVWATNSDIDEMTGGFPVISPSLNSNITEIAPSSEAE